MASLVKIGNSQGVRIPKQLLEQMQIQGRQVTLQMHEDGGVLIRPVKRKPRAGWEHAYAEAEKEAKEKGIKDPDWLGDMLKLGFAFDDEEDYSKW